MISAILLSLVVLGGTEILPFDFTVAERIFRHRNETLILLLRENTEDGRDILDSVCLEEIDCAVLEPSDSDYQRMVNFIGHPSLPIFAIVDSQNQKKYVLPLTPQLQANDLLHFKESFYRSTLEPYYASEAVPEVDPDSRCLQLVGSTYEQFLGRQQPIKIVYLYSSNQICQPCESLLVEFRELALKEWEEGLAVFGYLDVSRNDHWLIKDEIFPYFLIYLQDNFQDPFGASADDFKELHIYLREMKKQLGLPHSDTENQL